MSSPLNGVHLTLEEHEFACKYMIDAHLPEQPLSPSQSVFNIHTMSRKRPLEDEEMLDEPEPRATKMTIFSSVTQAVTGTIGGLFNTVFNLFRTEPEPVHVNAVPVGPKRRLVESPKAGIDVAQPTPIAGDIPGAWPEQSLALNGKLTDSERLARRDRMLQSDLKIPYWRKNNLPPHFPFPDLDRLLEDKYIHNDEPEEWGRTNYDNYLPRVANPKYHLMSRNDDGELKIPPPSIPLSPKLYNPVYFSPPPKKMWPRPKMEDREYVPDVNRYLPFQNIRKQATYKPTSVKEIEDKIRRYKEARQYIDAKPLHLPKNYPHGRTRALREHRRSLYGQDKATRSQLLHKSRILKLTSSPFKYQHGKNRPAQSALKSSHPNYRPFEPFLEGQEPKHENPRKSTSVAKNVPDGHEMEDISMIDPQPERGVRWPPPSQITGQEHMPTKFIYKNEPINTLPPHLRQYRDKSPTVDDSSLLEDSSPRRYFGHEQEKEPNYTIADLELDELGDEWLKKIQWELHKSQSELQNKIIQWNDPNADPDYTPSKAAQQRYIRNQERKRAQLEEKAAKIKARHDAERKVREELAAKKAAEERAIAEAQVAADEARREVALQEARAYEAAVSLIKPLSDEWNSKVDAAMANRNKDTVIVPKQNITRHDMGTILPQKGVDSSSSWLNDQIVNNSLTNMVDHALKLDGHNKSQTTVPAKYWAFNSNWHTTVQNKGGAGITRWAKKRGVNLGGKNLLEAEHIFFPVCQGNHWTLIVVSPRIRQIEYLDSLADKRYPPNMRIPELALDWIEHELGKKDFVKEEWTFLHNESATQDNGQDCGAFVIMNAMARLRGYKPKDWVQPQKMYEARRMIVAALMNGGFEGEFEWMELKLEKPKMAEEMDMEVKARI